MVRWRAVVAAGVVVALAAACSDGAGEVTVLDPAATAAAVTAPPTPALATVNEPVTVTTPADRVDEPITVHWIGGSDVAWDDYSLPDEFLADLPSFGDRPIVMRTSIVQAVMPVEMRRLVEEAAGSGADAIIMSVNPVWVQWDGSACLGRDLLPHEFYACLLAPVSPDVTAQRAEELDALFTAAAATGVPVYAYTQPHSAEVLADPVAAPAIEAAEAALAAFDPGLQTVRFRSRIFTRDTVPMREGVEFFDMVHPTPVGAAVLTDQLALDVADFWRAVTDWA